MGWAPAMRNPCERDARIEHHADKLRVEFYRGGRFQSVRELGEFQVREACELVRVWLLLGPAMFTVERFAQRGRRSAVASN